MALHFSIDERLFDPEEAHHGLLTLQEIADLEAEWGAVKMDEWCAFGRLKRAHATAYRLAGLPETAPIHIALFGHKDIKGVIDMANDGDRRAAMAVDEFREAVRDYERIRSEKVKIRARARGVRV